MIKKSVVKNIFFSLIAILFAFLFLELACRLYYTLFYKKIENKINKINEKDYDYYIPDPELGWIAKPCLTKLKYENKKKDDLDCTINSEGCRDIDFRIKNDNLIRILCLGDSTTEGRSVNYELTYPKILEKKLNSGFLLGVKEWEVYNCGVGDYGIAQEYLFLSKRLIRYSPDIVILGYFLNDPRGFVPIKALYIRQGVLKKLYDNSRLIFFINKIILKYAIKAQYKRWEKYRFNWGPLYEERKWIDDKAIAYKIIELAKNDWGLSWRNEGIEVAKKFLNKFVALSKKYNYKFIVVVFPVDIQLYASFEDEYLYKPQRMLGEFCKENNIIFVDLLPYLKQYKNRNLFIDHCHYTQEGLDLIANKLFEIINSHF